jgi:hypothetical protein
MTLLDRLTITVSLGDCRLFYAAPDACAEAVELVREFHRVHPEQCRRYLVQRLQNHSTVSLHVRYPKWHSMLMGRLFSSRGNFDAFSLTCIAAILLGGFEITASPTRLCSV